MINYAKRSFALISVALMILIVSFSFLFPASTFVYAAAEHMFDLAGYMTDSEADYVDRYLTELSDKLEFDLVGVITFEGNSGDDLMHYADDFYDYGGFGYGSNKDGAIFVVDMRSRQMTLVTTGYGTEAVTDYGEEVLYDYVTDSLKDGDFATAFTDKYADTIADYVTMAREGSAVDIDTPGHDGYDWYEDPQSSGYSSGINKTEAFAGAGGISIIIGAVAGLFSSQRQKSKLKTVRKKTQANSYARRDSLVLTRKQDRFLYSTVAVTPRPRDDRDDHHHGGGGTTMHTGSSGVPHGGGHGRGF